MATQKFNVGDLVRLKPKNSPDMAVQSVDTDGRKLWASWFSGKNLERGHFAIESLVPVEADEKQ